MLASVGLVTPPELWRVGSSKNFWRLVSSSHELRAFFFLLFPPLSSLPAPPFRSASSGRLSPLLARAVFERSVSSASAATTTVSVCVAAAAAVPTTLEPLARLAPRGARLIAPILEDRELAVAAPVPAPEKLTAAAAPRPRRVNTAPPISRAVGRGAMIESILPPEKFAPPPKKKVAARPTGEKKIAAIPAFGASGRSSILPSILGPDVEPAPVPKKAGLPRPSTKKEIAVDRPPLARLSPVGPPAIEEYIDAVVAPSTISASSRKGKEPVMVDTIPASTAESPAKSRHHRRIDSGADVEPPIVQGVWDIKRSDGNWRLGGGSVVSGVLESERYPGFG